ncbi:MAG: NAD(P)/FAD-dependent oxidoreductase [Deltaproteobacteria bacterium]|nr:NAD(P)/FAD-dependent oxidoreductase [Deltaproteobacteria bacterium]
METTYDFIIIGAGPNGLQTGAYLSKAGQKVLLLEQRYECGGGLWTEESTYPGFLHSTHAIYMMMADYAPVYQDFRLEEDYLVRHIHPELVFAMPFSDGSCLCLYKDLERTLQSIAQFSEKDAESYRSFYQLAKRCVEEFIAPATYVRPIGALDQIVKMQQTEMGQQMIEYSEKPAIEIINETFENERVKTLMLYLACHWGVRYDLNGLGYLALLYLNRAHNYQMVKGGSHMVPQALNKVIHENGGVVKNNQRVKRIIVEAGEAKGVEMAEGTVYEASKAVISSIDPEQTFLELIEEDKLEEEFVQKIKIWEWESYSLLGVHSALEERPNFSVAAANPEINDAFIYILGYEKVDDLISYLDAIYAGEIPKELAFNCCFPSNHDPELAPPGRCVSHISAMLPYNLKDGGPDKWYNFKFKQELTDRCLEVLERYAPNITKDTIFQTYISTPKDLENKFLDMKEGSIKQGAYTPFQMGYVRPNEECSHNRTPVKNLYLAGSCCYPGGCVIWGSGYLCSEHVAEDYGIEKWWKEPEMVTRLKESGMV